MATGFADLIPAWPADGAPDVATLLRRSEEDPGSLAEVERTVAHWLREAERVSGQRPITSPLVVRTMLTFPDGHAKRAGTLKVPVGKWVSIPLDEHYHRVLDSHHDGGRHWRVHLTAGAPTIEDLPELKPGWRYLVIAGGTPEEMTDPDKVQTLRTLCAARPVADVLFWHAPREGYPAMWSTRKGSGCSFSGGAWIPAEFPTSTPVDLLEVTLA